MKDMKTEDLRKMLQDLEEELERREREEEDKLRAEKEARYKEVIDAYDNFEELKTKFVEDYGAFTFKSEKNGYITHLWDFLNH